MSIGSDRSRLGRLLSEGSEALGCPLSGHQIEQFLIYLAELERWNRRLNLTGINDPDQVIEKHFLDSVAGIKAIGRTDVSRDLLDVGTGAGFPGLPLKIVLPSLRVGLLESSEKKASFLHHMIGKLHLRGAKVFNKGLDVLISETKRFDMVVARAFARKETFLAKAMKLLTMNGVIILYGGKSENIDSRLYEPSNFIAYELPFSKAHRHLEIYHRD